MFSNLEPEQDAALDLAMSKSVQVKDSKNNSAISNNYKVFQSKEIVPALNLSSSNQKQDEDDDRLLLGDDSRDNSDKYAPECNDSRTDSDNGSDSKSQQYKCEEKVNCVQESTTQGKVPATAVIHEKLELQKNNNIKADKKDVMSKNSNRDEEEVVLVYHCWLCGVDYLDKWSIVLHLKKSHGDRTELKGIELKMHTPICLECGSVDRCEHRKDQLNNIDDSQWGDFNEEDLAWPCSDCSQSFHSQNLLQKHREEDHQGGKNFQCSFCPSKFVSHSHLVAHARIHTGFRPHKCEICGSRFARRSDLDRHTRTHTGEKPFRCLQCDRTFSQRCSLEKHARIHAKHNGGLACEQCGLTFRSNDELSAHRDLEHADRKFPCTVCNKNFSAQHYLSLHMRTHTVPKSFTCSFCPKKFSHHSMLVKHEEKMHRNRAEIKCDECGRVFQRQENLNRHKRTHTGKRDFICPECGQAFTEKGSMKRHYASRHEQSRPHDCPSCDKSFSRKFLLTKHLEKHHPELQTLGEKDSSLELGYNTETGSGQVFEGAEVVIAQIGDIEVKKEIEDPE